MDPVKKFNEHFQLSHAQLCRGILERHQLEIRVKKPQVALDNLQRLLLAALKLGTSKGFHAMSMRDLSEASEMSMGALYNYIPDKNTLLWMILGCVSDAVGRVLVPLQEHEADDPWQRLCGLIQRHVLLSEAMQLWFNFAYMEVKFFDKKARDSAIIEELRTEQLLVDALEAGIVHGQLRPHDCVAVAGLIKPMLQDWYVKRWKHKKRGTCAEDYAAQILDFIQHALYVQPPRPQAQ